MTAGAPFTPEDLEALEGEWLAGTTAKEIGRKLGRTRSSILGKINRLGLQRKATARLTEVPIAEARKMVAATLGVDDVDDSDPAERGALICASSFFVGTEPRELARYTGYHLSACSEVWRIMRANRLWNADGRQDHNRYLIGGGEPGLQQGDIQLVLEGLLCGRRVFMTKDGSWWRPDMPELDMFAELVADHSLENGDPGGDVAETADRMGIPHSRAYHLMGKLEARLGAQAA